MASSSNPPQASSSNPPQKPRLTKGRRKIEMKRIPDEQRRLVAFSKRHAGVFKKASELCTLCGVEMAVIVFSPTKKTFAFGHPCIQTILDRFSIQNPRERSRASELIQHYRSANIEKLNTRLTNLVGELEDAKKTGEELNQIRKSKEEMFLWDAPIENLGVEELERLMVTVLDLKKDAEKQVEKLAS